MTAYLPWWFGATALALIGATHLWFTGRLLGVSGMFRRLTSFRQELQAEKLERDLLADQAATEAAMLEATREMFGDACDTSAIHVSPEASPPQPTPMVPLFAQLGFLLMLGAGGALGTFLLGAGPTLQASLGQGFSAHFGTSWGGRLLLVGGGVLVGFGTRMAGGCTSGHGLSGCSRLQPGSLLATACFFGTGVVVSFALGALVS